MREPQIIYFTSPWMPCGAFGVVNCLLEMGIKVSTYRRTHDDWLFDGIYHYPHAFKRFATQIPAFSDHKRFDFRPGIHVIWGHVFPYTHLYDHKVFMLTRDPRDALYHQYTWECRQREISYNDWIRWPFHETLLDMVDTWALYHKLWQQHPNLATFRFEDRCRNNRKIMQRILSFIGISIDEETLDTALWRSSYQRYCEKKSRPYDPEKKRFDLWRDRTEEFKEQAAIERAAGSVMRRYRYDPIHTQDICEADPFPLMALNPFFHDIPYYGSKNPTDVHTNSYLLKIMAFMRFIERHPQQLPEQLRTQHTWRELVHNYDEFQNNALRVGLIPRQHVIPQEIRP